MCGTLKKEMRTVGLWAAFLTMRTIRSDKIITSLGLTDGFDHSLAFL